MEPAVRRAEPADAAVLAELLEAACSAAGGHRGGPEAMERWPEGDLADPGVRAKVVDHALANGDLEAWLAELEGAVVGMALLRQLSGGSRVELVYVLEGARGVGVGDAFVETLLEATRASGGTWLDAVALPGDRAMKSLFERGGLVAREITLRRSLEG